MSRVLRIEHLARVEGHGGITVELDGNVVRRVSFDVFEGLRLFEGLVRGRSFSEVPQIVARICSICSVVHAVAALAAIEAAFEVEPSPQTRRLRDLLLWGENVESHALHLFLLAAPDLLGYPSAPAMANDHLEAVRVGLRLKQLGNRIQEVLGGRAIHPVNAVPGGFARLPSVAELEGLAAALEQGARDVAAGLEFLRGLPPADLGGVARTFAALAPAAGYGYGSGTEVVFLRDGERRRAPVGALAATVRERAVPHSHAKHASYRGGSFMVGALARLDLFGDRLNPAGKAAASALGLELPSCRPLDNNRAQAVELAHDVEACRLAVDALLAGGVEPETPVAVVPRAGRGVAVLEAPRGLLLHAYTFAADGTVVAADVITPTALNAADLEARLRELVAGHLDAGAADDDTVLRPRLEMLARAYDPCISCSVHLIRRGGGG